MYPNSPAHPILPAGIQLESGWWGRIVALYAHPPRAYHHVGHVREVLDHWSAVDHDGGWAQRSETFVAVLLHDAIYVPGASDNERRSAELVAPWALEYRADIDAQRVADLILLTAAHGHLGPGSVDDEAALFLDCDMAILGSEPDRFDRYGEEVRGEYANLSAEVFDAGRRAFLSGLLERRIFLSERFHTRYEHLARANIHRTLAS